MYIIPFDNWHEDEEGFEIDPSLNFTWNVTSFADQYMNLTLNFSQPQWVSPLYIRDQLVIHFFENASNFFISDDFLQLQKENRTI